jgi:hypothetical protein
MPEQRLLWWDGYKSRKAILIFDSGYKDETGKPIGNLYVYELVRTVSASDLRKETERLGSPTMTWRILPQ